MFPKIAINPTLSVFVILSSVSAAQAQNVQNFLNNEENQIQQDSAVGALNSKQTAAIQNRQAGIMYQEQQDKNQNGGSLTPQETQQIAGEERRLKNNVNRNVYGNNSTGSNGGLFNKLESAFGHNQNNPNNLNFAQQQQLQQLQLQQQQQQNWRNNSAQNQNGYNPNAQYNQNFNNAQGYHHHRFLNNNNNVNNTNVNPNSNPF